jgi:hypothetical protein
MDTVNRRLNKGRGGFGIFFRSDASFSEKILFVFFAKILNAKAYSA